MLPINATSPKYENTFQNRRAFSEKELNRIITDYTLLDLYRVKQLWNLRGRAYHNWEHAQYMLFLAETYYSYIVASNCNYEALVLAIIFHDIIYIPGSKNNEQLSADFFMAALKPQVDYGYDLPIYTAIKQTQYLTEHGKPVDYNQKPMAWWLQQLDLYPLIVNDRRTCMMNFVLVWEEFKEICHGDTATFEHNQNSFLAKLAYEFGFAYEPITWKDIEAEKEKPLDLE